MTPYRGGVSSSPNFVRFGATGVVVGVILAAVLAATAPPSDYTGRQIFFYLCLLFGFLGALLALGVALLIDARNSRRRR